MITMIQRREGGFLISKIHYVGRRIFSQMLKRDQIDVNPGQGRILYVLWHNDEIPINELAKQTALGKSTLNFLEKKKLLRFLETAKNLYRRFDEQIKTQIDFAVDEGGRKLYSLRDLPLDAPILDIGDQTIEEYARIIEQASTIVLNGPMGKFEESGFEKGTVAVFKAMEKSHGFSLAGGGHSVSIIEKNNIKLSYVSTAGKALIQFLMGKPLPAILALSAN